MRSANKALASDPVPIGALVIACTAVLWTACTDRERAASCPAGMPGAVAAGRVPVRHDDAEFTELWRVGGMKEREHLSVPLPVALSRQGRAAIADFDLGELFVIEPDGQWRGSVASRGMGPGELTSPVAAVWADDGALHVYDLGRPAILRFDRDLTYAGEVRAQSDAAAAILASGRLDWAGVQPSGATVLMPGLSSTGAGDGTEHALRIASPTAPADTLRSGLLPVVRADGYEDVAVPGYSRIAASVGAGGRLAMIGGNLGRLVDVYEDGGTLTLRLCSDAPVQPLTDEERGRGVADSFRELTAAFSEAVAAGEPARHGRVVLGADGTVWVERERPNPYPASMRFYGEPGTTFDVFSMDGRRVRTLRLPRTARLQAALGDTIWAYEVGEFDEVHLIAYEITMR